MRTILNSVVTIILLVFTGCVTLYKPNSLYSPMLQEKGDGNVSASLGITGTGLMNLQGSYALTDHFGVMASGMYHNRRDDSNEESVEKLNILSGEAGAGYFQRTGANNDLLFQCFGGLGHGSSRDIITNTSQDNPEARALFYNLFFQPGLVITGRNIEVAFDLRANYVHLYNIHAYLYDQFEFWNTDFRYYSDTTISFMNLEPALTLRIGGGNLKGLIQFGAIIPAVNAESYFNVNNSSVFLIPLIKFSAGLTYTFGNRK